MTDSGVEKRRGRRDAGDEMGSPVTKHDIRIDVSQAVGVPDTVVAATLIVPTDTAESRMLAVAFPGGAYSRGYWDIQWPWGYSQAEYHAQRGWLFAAVDHVGVGESSLLDPSTLTLELLAQANAAASRSVVSLLASGDLDSSAGPVEIPFVLGIGQSMGGCLSIVTQALHQPFDALAVLGYSASHTVLPSPGGGLSVSAVVRATTDTGVDAFGWSFHFDDVDPAIRHEDLRGGFHFRTESVPPWGSATIPHAAGLMLAPGVVAREAAAITVPVFIGLGERDVCTDPWTEARSYRGTRDVTLCVVERMAHMHNFGSSRRCYGTGCTDGANRCCHDADGSLLFQVVDRTFAVGTH